MLCSLTVHCLEYQIWKLTSFDRLLFRSLILQPQVNQLWIQLQFGWKAHWAAYLAYEQKQVQFRTTQTSQQISCHFSDPLDLLHGLLMSRVRQSQVTAIIGVLVGSNSTSATGSRQDKFGIAAAKSVLLGNETSIPISQNTTVTPIN